MSLKVKITRMTALRGIHNTAQFRRLLEAALPLAGLDTAADGLVSFVLVTPARMARLNAMHLHHEGTTDVITYDWRGQTTFGPAEDETPLAEIFICPQVAREYARRLGTTASHELLLYAVHGLLHLAGEDDLDEASRRSMRAAEARVLSALEPLMPPSPDFLTEE